MQKRTSTSTNRTYCGLGNAAVKHSQDGIPVSLQRLLAQKHRDTKNIGTEKHRDTQNLKAIGSAQKRSLKCFTFESELVSKTARAAANRGCNSRKRSGGKKVLKCCSTMR